MEQKYTEQATHGSPGRLRPTFRFAITNGAEMRGAGDQRLAGTASPHLLFAKKFVIEIKIKEKHRQTLESQKAPGAIQLC